MAFGSAFLSAINPWLGAASAIGSILGRRNRDRSSAQFNTRMQDMEAYGIHPLAAIGGSGMTGIGQGAVQTRDMVKGIDPALARKRATAENARVEGRIDTHRREDKAHDIKMIEAQANARNAAKTDGSIFNHPVAKWAWDATSPKVMYDTASKVSKWFMDQELKPIPSKNRVGTFPGYSKED